MKFKNLSLILPLFFSVIALSLHAYLGTLSRYLADDFCSAYQAHRLGIFRAAWFWYLNWSGRFSASILDATVGSFHPNLIRFVVALTILLWLIVLTVFFIYILEPRDNKFLISLTLACVTLFTLFLLAPDIRQSLYWGQGMRSVLPPLMLGTIQVMLWKYVQSKAWSNLQIIGWGIFSFFVALIAGGFSETYAAFQVAALFCVLLILLLLQRSTFSASLLFTATALVGAICALLFMLLAPGNALRQASYPAPPGILGILMISLRSYFSYILHLFDSSEKILAILGTFTLAASIGGHVSHHLDKRLVFVILFFMLAFMFVCFPPSAYGLSDAPPPRTQILPTYFFLAGLVALGIVCGNLLQQQNKSLTVSTTIAVIAIIFAASINSIHLYQSRGEFIQYAKEWDQTEASILAAKQNGSKEVLIPIIPNWAQLNTPNDNPKFWVNVCLSLYYDVQIRAEPNVSSQ
jgi:hypothetical protein